MDYNLQKSVAYLGFWKGGVIPWLNTEGVRVEAPLLFKVLRKEHLLSMLHIEVMQGTLLTITITTFSTQLGNRTLSHQDTAASRQFGNKNWCRSVWTFRCQNFLLPKCLVLTSDWCRTVLVPDNQDKTRQDNSGTSRSAMAERPRKLGDFKKARVNGGTDNQSLNHSQFPQVFPQPLTDPHHMVIK